MDLNKNDIEKMTNKLVVFEDKKIRRIFHDEEWYFSVIDVIEVLTGSSNPRRYWSDFKRQLVENEGFIQLYEKIVQLKLESNDGKKYETDTANTETVFRIIQSIPSPKAEPFKRWLAKVGYERVQEIDLLLPQKDRFLGFEFKYTDAPKLTKSMQIALQDLKLSHLYVIYPGTIDYPIAENITVKGLQNYL